MCGVRSRKYFWDPAVPNAAKERKRLQREQETKRQAELERYGLT